jgi:hypothetical protein
MQSPMGWQVRICAESNDDRWTIGAWNTGNTISVGKSGSTAGDFQVGGPHTHGGLFWNDNKPTRRNGQQCGIDPILAGFSAWKTGQWRVFIWGDDQTGSTIIINRNVTVGADALAMFGMPEQEPQPVPIDMVHRIFTVGECVQNNPSISWSIATKNEYFRTGQAFGFSNQPISCVFSTYHAIDSDNNPRDLVTRDNPVFQAIELIPVELLAGTWRTQHIRGSPNNQNMVLEPRRMGLVPMARMGRSNLSSWTLSADKNLSWFHIMDGIYLPWAGPPALP